MNEEELIQVIDKTMCKTNPYSDDNVKELAEKILGLISDKRQLIDKKLTELFSGYQSRADETKDYGYSRLVAERRDLKKFLKIIEEEVLKIINYGTE